MVDIRRTFTYELSRSRRGGRAGHCGGNGTMDVRKGAAFVAISFGALALGGGTAFAHECFNPNKPDGAGVNYAVVGFDENGPIFVQVGPGKGIGGFADVFGTDVHTIGHSGSKEVVGGPGSQTDEHGCDGKGIDYLSACGG